MRRFMPLPIIAALIGVALGGTLLVLKLLHLFTRDAGRDMAIRLVPADLGGFNRRGLILSSILSLFLELLLIRWISSEIRIFAYFKNFVLIACFLGFGVGCYLCRRAIPVVTLIAPLLFFVLLIQLPWKALRALIATLPVLLGATSEMHIWGVGSMQLTPVALIGLLLASVVTLPIFALLAVAFIPIGQLVGWYLENAPDGVAAYSINVAASLAGIGLYTGLCFANLPPAAWFAVAGVLAVALFWSVPRARWALGATFAVSVALLFLNTSRPGAIVYWSPYQKLALTPLRTGQELYGYNLETNSTWFQKIIDLSPSFVSRHPELFRRVPVQRNAYNLPYLFEPRPDSVLILGSGMGNDVAAALRNGAQHVTAVEIDPLIVRLGRELHPEHPYSSPRVTTRIDDARSYVQNSRDRFDLIVFSLLDSHTTSSHFSNIRIDNYVYTVEAMRAAKKLLAPGGVFIVKFQVQRPWIAGRLHDVISDVFAADPLHLQSEGEYASSGRFFIVGPPDKIGAALGNPFLRAYAATAARMPMEHVNVTTDDWPYFYQRDRGLPTSVVTISILLLIVSFLAARSIDIHVRSLRLEFFFLGAAFLLLEAQIISRMALLFGTTWVVNSIVIAVLLTLILAANAVAVKFPNFNAGAAYVGIFATTLIGYSLPEDALFFRSFVLRATVATFILTLPVFFAGIVFIKRFAESSFAAEAIGSNLLGSLVGGIAESLSLAFGLHALLLLAALLYGAAWLASVRQLKASVATAS
jgi:spermidine synthase